MLATLRALFVHTVALCAVTVVVSSSVSSAVAAKLRVGFAADLQGESSAATMEFLEGARAAAGKTAASGLELELVAIDTAGKSAKEIASAVRKAKVRALLAAPDGASMPTITAVARRDRLPLVLLTPWEPRFTLDTRDPVTHLSAGHVDHAMGAGNYALIPLEATRAAVLHDGSDASKDLAAAFARNRPIPLADGGVFEVPATIEETKALGKQLEEEKVDLLFVATGPSAAHRVAAAIRTGPRLLFADGLGSRALAAIAPATAHFLSGVSPYFDGGSLVAYRERDDESGVPSPVAQRGHAGMCLLADALTITGNPKKLAAATRRVSNPRAADSSVLTAWGAPRESVHFLCKQTDDGIARINPLTLPDVGGGNLLRYRDTSSYAIDSETRMILLTWGSAEEATIDDDLKALGLSSRGYEADMDAWVKDEILARAMAYLHRVFDRNADGTAIAGVSYDITFGTEVPAGVKPHHIWTVTIAGDDPEAWGRAFPPNRAYAYASKLANLIYKKYALEPALRHEDKKYFIYKYRWNESLQKNLRHDSIRALVDGYASAVAMTTAHEVGHLGGCGHDRESPRSIMNVVDGGGISPLWAEWIPSHVKKLEASIERVKPNRL